MNDTLGPARSPDIVAVSWGLLGGLSIVASDAFGTPRTRALMIILAYAAVVIGSSVAARHAGSYRRRFALGLGAFMSATVVMYGYLIAVVNPVALGFSFWEHAWRLGFMATLGIVATAIPLALGALIGRFGGGQGASRAPLTENPARGGRDSGRPRDTLLLAERPLEMDIPHLRAARPGRPPTRLFLAFDQPGAPHAERPPRQRLRSNAVVAS